MTYLDVDQENNLNNKKTPIDVNYEELDKIYTIDEVAKAINVDQSRISFYYEKLNDFLKIQSVGAFQLFNETDIDNLRRIKHLDEDLDMNMTEIRKYLSINKQDILIERKVENTISVDNFGTLLGNLFSTINTQNHQINTIVNVISELNDNVKKMSDQQNNMQSQLDAINSEMAATKELSDISDKYRLLLQERNVTSQEQKNIFKRLLNKLHK